MEKIAIFDTSTGGTPSPPITPASISLVYGQFAPDQRRVEQNMPSNRGWCNLCGGGSDAVGSASDDSVRGNVFVATYDISTELFVAWGTVVGTSPTMIIGLYENGINVDSFTINSAQLVSNSQRSFPLSISQFLSNNAYAIRFSLTEVGSSVEVTGWSIGVAFNTL